MEGAEIKENQLPDAGTPTSDDLKNMFARIVKNKTTSGESGLVQFAKLIFKMANVEGLSDEFAKLVYKLTTDTSTHLLKGTTLGGIADSGYSVGSFDELTTLDACLNAGFYSATSNTILESIYIKGYIYYALIGQSSAGEKTEILFTSNGLFYRTYLSEWSIPRYIGGAFNNLVLTISQAQSMMSDGQLNPGCLYNIASPTQTGYVSIFLQAVSPYYFEDEGVAILPVPIHRASGVFTIGGTDQTSIGVWRNTKTAAIGNICWYCGLMYRNLTGAIGAAESGFVLDGTNWLMLTPDSYPEYYVNQIHGISYDVAAKYAKREWDAFDNEFGDRKLAGDNFQTRYNDWYYNIDGGSFFGNKLLRCYNNEKWAENGDSISKNTGDGQIRNCVGQANTIEGNTFIRKDNISLPTLSINSNEAIVVGNTISGYILDNIASLTGSNIKGTLTNNVGIMIDNTIIEGYCTLSNKTSNGYEIRDSHLYTTDNVVETFTADRYIVEHSEDILVELSADQAVVTIVNGVYAVPTFQEGGFLTRFNNGFTVSGGTITTKYPGIYEVEFSVSAYTTATPNPMTASVYVNGAASGLRSSITYPAVDSWISRSFHGLLNLNKGDQITIRYYQNTGNNLSLTIDCLRYTVLYKGNNSQGSNI